MQPLGPPSSRQPQVHQIRPATRRSYNRWLGSLEHIGHNYARRIADPGHGNAIPRYAIGCLVYTFITGKDPRKNPFWEISKPWSSAADSPKRFAPHD